MFYESLGCLVFIKEHSRYSKDIWGLFDGLVLSLHEGLIFIQIKTNRFGKVTDIGKFCERYGVNADIIMFKDRDNEPYFRSFRNGYRKVERN